MSGIGPTRAARYELRERVGAGGMGEVWRGWDRILRRDVAIKRVMTPAAGVADRVTARRLAVAEARAAARINNPHAVHVYDVVELAGWPCVVMEYIPSRSLREIVVGDGPLPVRYVAAVGLAVLDALVAAHRVGILHRDVKPGNILIARTGRVVLTDFGIATRRSGVVDGDEHIVATPAYVAPERLVHGMSLPAGDLWSLGASLYLAIEGRAPYTRVSPQATVAAIATLPPDPPERAGALRPVLDGLLDHDPASRLRPGPAGSMLLAVARGRDGAMSQVGRPVTVVSGALRRRGALQPVR